MIQKNSSAIGVFDSGLGGLTVAKAIMRVLPDEDIIYFGDTARVPYGTKSKESIIRFSKENVKFLLEHKVKMIVVACNSSSSHALSTLKQSFSLPILGVIEPGVRKAVKTTRNKRVGVIATPATINSQAYTQYIKSLDPKIKVFSQACPLFVPLVEEGWFNKEVTLTIAQDYLKNIKKAGIDTLILGCTHYPLLKTVIKKVMGMGVSLIDSAQQVAIEVKQSLDSLGHQAQNGKNASYRFYVSDESEHFRSLAKRFLGMNINKVEKVDVDGA